MLRDGVHGGIPPPGRQHRGRPCAAGGFRRRRGQRLAGGEPVHGDRRPAQPPAGHRGLRQRPAAGRDRTEERGRRRRDDLERLRAAADLQGGDSRRCCTTTQLLVVSDGLQARIGSLTANQEWFKVWRTIDGEGDAPKSALELEVLVRGVFEQQRFLDLLQHFIVFEEDPDSGRAAQDHRRLPPVPRRERGGGGNRARQRHGGTGARCATSRAPTGPGGCTAASRATAARAWSGTRRAAARASRCCSTPRASSGIRRCRTRRWWC